MLMFAACLSYLHRLRILVTESKNLKHIVNYL